MGMKKSEVCITTIYRHWRAGVAVVRHGRNQEKVERLGAMVALQDVHATNLEKAT